MCQSLCSQRWQCLDGRRMSQLVQSAGHSDAGGLIGAGSLVCHHVGQRLWRQWCGVGVSIAHHSDGVEVLTDNFAAALRCAATCVRVCGASGASVSTADPWSQLDAVRTDTAAATPACAAPCVRVCGGSGAASVSRSLITQTVLRTSSTLPPALHSVPSRVSESVQPALAVSRWLAHGRSLCRRLVTRMLAASLTPPPSSAVMYVSASVEAVVWCRCLVRSSFRQS